MKRMLLAPMALTRAFLGPMREQGGGRIVQISSMGGQVAVPTLRLTMPPGFFFTTARSVLEPQAYALTSILGLPYILWAYDRSTGHALILGNRSESNVSRPYEPGDQELIEGALSVYIDVLLNGASLGRSNIGNVPYALDEDALERFLRAAH